MRIRAGWGVVVAALATGMGVGCGQENRGESLQVTAPGNDAETPAQTPAPTPAPADNTAPPPPVDRPELPPGPIVDPIVDTSDWLKVPACIPVATAPTPRHPHACSVKRFWVNGPLMHLKRFDAQGNLLEESFFSKDGTPSSSTHYDYEQGREVRREERDEHGGRTITERTYDGAGRLAYARVLSGQPPKVQDESRYLYDPQGRLERLQHYKTLSDGTQEVTRQYRYLYGATGLLEARKQSDIGITWWSLESFTYHPNGKLRQRTLEDYVFSSPHSEREDYDEQGHLLFSEWMYDEGGTRRTYLYDARGRRVEMKEAHGSTQGHEDRRTQYLYDEAGRIGLERLTADGDYPWASTPYSVRRREVKRSFYSCGGDLLLEDQDTNEDGLRDGWHELVRDVAGNLLIERFEGTFTRWTGISRIEYEYDCHE